ncbi:hypothetical protein ACN3XK_74270, partial [Actinomadura welshii]
MPAIISFFGLLFGILFGMIVAPGVVVWGVVHAVRNRRRPAERLRGAALLALGLALGMYTWGMAHLLPALLDAEDGGTDSSPLRPCRGDADAATVARVIDYKVGFVPLRFECRLTGGGSYVASVVPGYVNPATGVLAAAWAAGLFFGRDRERTSRKAGDETGAA